MPIPTSTSTRCSQYYADLPHTRSTVHCLLLLPSHCAEHSCSSSHIILVHTASGSGSTEVVWWRGQAIDRELMLLSPVGVELLSPSSNMLYDHTITHSVRDVVWCGVVGWSDRSKTPAKRSSQSSTAQTCPSLLCRSSNMYDHTIAHSVRDLVWSGWVIDRGLPQKQPATVQHGPVTRTCCCCATGL